MSVAYTWRKTYIDCGEKMVYRGDHKRIVVPDTMNDHHVEIGYGCHILMGAVVRNKVKVEPLTRVESLSLVE